MTASVRHILAFLLLYLGACDTKRDGPVLDSGIEAVSLLGAELRSPAPAEPVLAALDSARRAYEADTSNADNLIWYGRRTAYAGRFREAIELFTRGIDMFPKDARFLRHRGHRHITRRRFEDAIADLEAAAALVQGAEDAVEPDGMPNARNIPLTSLHSNIWYHLGLAYYLIHDWDHAYDAFTQCRSIGLNDDNLVSSTHWVYMILRRMGREEEAAESLDIIGDDMTIIENDSYWKLCMFYKGLLREDELIDQNAAAPANDAVRYGVANWHLYNGRTDEAIHLFEELLQGPSWASFGFIAAEADLHILSPQLQ